MSWETTTRFVAHRHGRTNLFRKSFAAAAAG